MKKIYGTMFVAALCSSASLFAQDAPAKKYFLGGSVGFNSTTQENTTGAFPNYVTTKGTNTTYTVAPEFGFYIRKNTALGIKLAYSHSGGDNLYTSNSYVASPFVRFIVPIGSSRFSVYNDLGISAGYSENMEGMAGGGLVGDAKTLNLGAFYEPGIQFRLKHNINLMATLGNLLNYDYHNKTVKAQNDRSVKTSNTGHNVGINNDFFAFNSFRLGVNLLF
jgi:hypothetical protein